MWYEDLSSYDPEGWARAVGWLERGHDFATGPVRSELLEKLELLFRNRYMWVASPGVHDCDFCAHRRDAPSGAGMLWVPGNGVLYVCPDLIRHYIRVHQYLPPEEFCEAVLRCPKQDTAEFRRAYLENGGRELEGEFE